jgi:hypothetical protein
MVNKQVIDNSLYMMDNEVRNPFVQMTRNEEKIFSLFFLLFSSSRIEERRNTCSLSLSITDDVQMKIMLK